MIIKKIDYDEKDGILTVWTDVFENMGFNFKIEDLTTKADLKTQVKMRVDSFLAEKAEKATKKLKADTFKSLENQEI